MAMPPTIRYVSFDILWSEPSIGSIETFDTRFIVVFTSRFVLFIPFDTSGGIG